MVDSRGLSAAGPPRPLMRGRDLLKVVAAFRRTEAACVALPRQYLIALPADCVADRRTDRLRTGRSDAGSRFVFHAVGGEISVVHVRLPVGWSDTSCRSVASAASKFRGYDTTARSFGLPGLNPAFNDALLVECSARSSAQAGLSTCRCALSRGQAPMQGRAPPRSGAGRADRHRPSREQRSQGMPEIPTPPR